MKNKASGFLKQIITVLTTMSKAKTLALKRKTRALKARLVIFSLLQNKKILMSAVSQKLNALMGQNDRKPHSDNEDISDFDVGDKSKGAIVVFNRNAMSPLPNPTRTELLGQQEEYEENSKYPDLTHSLFDSKDMAFKDPGGSVIDIVKNSKEDKGEEFKLEDEIDQVADLFIRRFYRQIRMQKQLSLKRYEEMLEGSG